MSRQPTEKKQPDGCAVVIDVAQPGEKRRRPCHRRVARCRSRLLFAAGQRTVRAVAERAIGEGRPYPILGWPA
ncbi:MAG: hypothetical protein H0V23_12610 [Nocardioidaceae bacterium]|nr:hypothetical protein [Nocardioidaceae bacterium]